MSDDPAGAWQGTSKISEHAFLINHERAVDYLSTRERLYVFDGYAGWDPKYRPAVGVGVYDHAIYLQRQ
ncbi:Protein kinase C-like 1 [Podila horticola]|nr:Protein kinase C-like 1 [Podila horticola]